MSETLRVGIVGLGANTRLRHVPGLTECESVRITAVCNRRPESTAAAAEEFRIPKTYEHWEDLVADVDIDAVVIGTWPYLHCPVAVAALDAGKHVLTEARMANNADEARQMLDASRRHPELVAQIVPSPFGLRAHNVIKELIADNYLGELREVAVLGTNDQLADPARPLHWRQVARLSGVNMLTLGILHETLLRFVPQPVRVSAHCQTFTTTRPDEQSGVEAPVETPDVVHVLTELPGGTCGLYHLSGVARHGPGNHLHLYGSAGTLKYDLGADKLYGARAGKELAEIYIPEKKERRWRVEADFVDAIRGQGTIELTDFETGVRYMEFTQAVADSAASGKVVELS